MSKYRHSPPLNIPSLPISLPFSGIDMETVAKNLVFKNITLITVSYRLGPFGFMSVHHPPDLSGAGSGSSSSTASGSGTPISSTPVVEGNFGIWDQKLALEWIHRNIKQFNGDPSKLTVSEKEAVEVTKSKFGSV
jgi:para-nitrobenzyl esterase